MINKKIVELRHGSGRTALRLRVLHMGKDLCLLLDGGHRPHTGAVAVAHSGTSAPECIALPGHREDALACHLAHRVHHARSVTTTVLCGVHIDAITRAEIEEVLAGAEALVTQWLTQTTHSKDTPC